MTTTPGVTTTPAITVALAIPLETAMNQAATATMPTIPTTPAINQMPLSEDYHILNSITTTRGHTRSIRPVGELGDDWREL